MTVEAYPLCWPQHKPRTNPFATESARFKSNFVDARKKIMREIDLLGGSDLILSTNIPLKQNGMPYANGRDIEDRGVAIYFIYKKRQRCFACDRWNTVADNLQAIIKTIDALRGIARWGTGDMLEAAFNGFDALPNDSAGTWWMILGVHKGSLTNDVETAYKRLRSAAHPDKNNGDATEFNKIQTAYEQWKALQS